MKYWVIGVTAALTLFAAGPIPFKQTVASAGPSYASIDDGQAGSN